MKSIIAAFMAVVMTLSAVGCGSGTASNLVTALNAVVEASSVAVVVVDGLAAIGKLSQSDADLATTYATATGTAANQSIAELKSSDTNPDKITKISGYFAAVAKPALSPAIAAIIGPAIQTIVTTVEIFLGKLNGPAVTTAAKKAPTAPIVLTGADKAMLKKMQEKIAATATKAKAVKAVK